ncbi:MAG: isoprenylcysteine carboxylmethyltransferase family protein [Planctomycetota bacterium]|nr:isoprenylcysteine carboxylmethyltransferase family protein [Planctomycetota bacterium]
MTATSERGARVRFPPPLVFLGCVLLAIAMQLFVAPLGVAAARPFSLIAGVVLVAAGVTTVASARVLFLRTGQCPTPWSPTPELIARGPYRFTRNPMYMGITTLLIGAGLVSNVLWISAFAPLALAIVHFIAVVKEEGYLAAKFGPSYAAYAARVRRYL